MPAVIDQRKGTYKVKPLYVTIETVETTLTLIETNPGAFGLNYEVNYSGLKQGHAAGGPIPVSSNGSWSVYNNPPVNVSISNYSDDPTTKTVSFHISVVVSSSIPGVGNITIFDETMGGKYGTNAIAEMMSHIAVLMSEPSAVR